MLQCLKSWQPAADAQQTAADNLHDLDLSAAVHHRWAEGAVSPSAVARTECGIYVNSHFDSGNIEVVSCWSAVVQRMYLPVLLCIGQ